MHGVWVDGWCKDLALVVIFLLGGRTLNLPIIFSPQISPVVSHTQSLTLFLLWLTFTTLDYIMVQWHTRRVLSWLWPFTSLLCLEHLSSVSVGMAALCYLGFCSNVTFSEKLFLTALPQMATMLFSYPLILLFGNCHPQRQLSSVSFLQCTLFVLGVQNRVWYLADAYYFFVRKMSNMP